MSFFPLLSTSFSSIQKSDNSSRSFEEKRWIFTQFWWSAFKILNYRVEFLRRKRFLKNVGSYVYPSTSSALLPFSLILFGLTLGKLQAVHTPAGGKLYKASDTIMDCCWQRSLHPTGRHAHLFRQMLAQAIKAKTIIMGLTFFCHLSDELTAKVWIIMNFLL